MYCAVARLSGGNWKCVGASVVEVKAGCSGSDVGGGGGVAKGVGFMQAGRQASA